MEKEGSDFNFIIRFLNTNLNGKRKVPYALTGVKGVGIRIALLVCTAAGVDINKRCGELSDEDMARVEKVLLNPLEHNVPVWLLNRQKDIATGQDIHVVSNGLDSKLREDLERMKKLKGNRGLRHVWGLKVRGQHTKSTGRRGKTVGVSKKKSG
ncbi:MAG: 40S ribosomal protein S18 [Amphiamblys sp. WSBS2006]|nr:MAG: 40S ribosomal protein S18 [Amphiamblys sp. WSBS2006]